MSNVIRPLLAIVGVLGAIFAPPWIPLICMGLLAFRYPAWEVLLIGILVDFIWLPGTTPGFPLFTIAGFILAWGLEPLRKEFLFH